MITVLLILIIIFRQKKVSETGHNLEQKITDLPSCFAAVFSVHWLAGPFIAVSWELRTAQPLTHRPVPIFFFVLLAALLLGGVKKITNSCHYRELSLSNLIQIRSFTPRHTHTHMHTERKKTHVHILLAAQERSFPYWERSTGLHSRDWCWLGWS